MGELADSWRGHLAESRVTELVATGTAGQPIPPLDLDDFARNVIAELAVIHQQILTMCQAIDDLRERLS